MGVKGRRVTVTTTATRLDTEDESDNIAGQTIFLRNADAVAAVSIGGPDVTAADGYQLAAAAALGPVALSNGEGLYGIAASGSVVVHVLELAI